MKRIIHFFLKKLVLLSLFLATSQSFSQNDIIVNGTISDSETGNPLPFINVLVKGLNNGTTTNENGEFSIEVSPDAILIISYLGYKTLEVPINNRETISIQMVEDVSGLDEIVLTGYSSKARKTVTGAISDISSDEIEQVPTAMLSGGLAGKLPGLSFRMADGRPGAGAEIQIRNMGTPLYVIDGIIQKDSGLFNNLASNDIESISILKDASAAIYGSRAANGVVVVKTKRGERNQAPRVNIDAYYGIQNWTRFPEGVNAYEWMLGKINADINQYGSTNITEDELAKWRLGEEQGYRSFDWYDFIVEGNAPQSNVNANLSGGSENTNYYISLNRFDQKAVFSDDFEFNRTSLQSSISSDISDRLNVGVQISGYIENRLNPGLPDHDDYWMPRFALFRNRPTERPYANDNSEYPANINNITTNWALLNYDTSGYYEDRWRVLRTNFRGEYDLPVNGLKIQGLYSYSFSDNYMENFEYTFDVYDYNPENDQYVRTGGNDNPYRGRRQRKIEENVVQLQLNYDNTFGDKHNFSLLGLVETVEKKDYSNFVHSVPTNNFLDLFQYSDVDTYDDFEAEEARVGYVGRINYDYDSKYLVEISSRYDASWKFAPGKRWGFFPSASLGWRITEESFMEKIASVISLDDLKLRISYGELGDDNIGIGAFDYIPGYNYGASTVIVDGQNMQGSANRGKPIDNLSWYTSKNFNTGFDFSMFEGKLTGSADYFYRKRDGLRDRRDDIFLPAELGYDLTDENLSSDATIGFDFGIRYENSIGNFNYRIGGTFGFARNKFLHSYNPTFSSSWEQYRSSGEERWNGIFWGYEVIGQFSSIEQINDYPVNIDGQGNSTLLPGDFIYKDVNNDGKIDGYDERPIGYSQNGPPIMNFGLNLSFDYKNFDLIMDLSGGTLSSYNQNWEMRWPYQNGGNLLRYMYDDRWHREDPYDPNSAWVPGENPPLRYNTGYHNNYNKNSTWWLTNITYLKMRTMSLGYTLPEKIIEKLQIERLRVYFQTYNLFSIDNVSKFGIDPEIRDENGLQYPQNRNINLGFNITL